MARSVGGAMPRLSLAEAHARAMAARARPSERQAKMTVARGRAGAPPSPRRCRSSCPSDDDLAVETGDAAIVEEDAHDLEVGLGADTAHATTVICAGSRFRVAAAAPAPRTAPPSQRSSLSTTEETERVYHQGVGLATTVAARSTLHPSTQGDTSSRPASTPYSTRSRREGDGISMRPDREARPWVNFVAFT